MVVARKRASERMCETGMSPIQRQPWRLDDTDIEAGRPILTPSWSRTPAFEVETAFVGGAASEGIAADNNLNTTQLQSGANAHLL